MSMEGNSTASTAFSFSGRGFDTPTPEMALFLMYALKPEIFFLLFHEYRPVRVGLLTVCGVERADILQLVHQHAVLVDIHVGDVAVIVGQVVGVHLPVVRCQTFQHPGTAQPPVRISDPTVRVAANACLHMITDKAGQNGLVYGFKVPDSCSPQEPASVSCRGISSGWGEASC